MVRDERGEKKKREEEEVEEENRGRASLKREKGSELKEETEF